MVDASSGEVGVQTTAPTSLWCVGIRGRIHGIVVGSLRRLVRRTSARASMVPCGVGLSQRRRFPFHHARAPMRIAQHTLAFRVLGLRGRTMCLGITFTWPFPLRFSCSCIVVVRCSRAWIHVRPPTIRQRTRRLRHPSVRFHSSFEPVLRLLRHPTRAASATYSLTWCCSDVLPSPTQVRRIRSPLNRNPALVSYALLRCHSFFISAGSLNFHPRFSISPSSSAPLFTDLSVFLLLANLSQYASSCQQSDDRHGTT